MNNKKTSIPTQEVKTDIRNGTTTLDALASRFDISPSELVENLRESYHPSRMGYIDKLILKLIDNENNKWSYRDTNDIVKAGKTLSFNAVTVRRLILHKHITLGALTLSYEMTPLELIKAHQSLPQG